MGKSKNNHYSDEVQEVMKEIPGVILKKGLGIIFGIICLIIIGSYYFKYPEIVTCSIKLTTTNPPVEIFCKQAGQLDVIFKSDNEYIRKGDIIALIKNTALYEHMLKLEKILYELKNVPNWLTYINNVQLDSALSTGEVQVSYMRFYKAWHNLKNYYNQKYIPQKIALLNEQINKKYEFSQSLKKQRGLLKKDLDISKRQFQRDSTFFLKYGNDAISIGDFEKQAQNYIQKQASYMNFCSTIKNVESELLQLYDSKIDLEIQLKRETNEYLLELDEAGKLLNESFLQWKKKYVLLADVTGKITFTGNWSKNQSIKVDDRIATIIPDSSNEIIGRGYIDMRSISKVKIGQIANIKLSGFPYLEYGMLKGMVRNISLVPEKNKGYFIEIILKTGMISTYQEKLFFIQEMEGSAEIIVKKNRLIHKLFNPLKAFFDK